jgi:hypothetical protein
MNTSPFLDEIREELREGIREEVREEIREESRAEGARTLVVRMGRKKFRKPPTKKHQKALEAIADLPRLEALAERLFHANSWGELLGEG